MAGLLPSLPSRTRERLLAEVVVGMAGDGHVHVGGLQGAAGVRAEDVHGTDKVQGPLAGVETGEDLLEQRRGPFAFRRVLRSIGQIAASPLRRVGCSSRWVLGLCPAAGMTACVCCTLIRYAKEARQQAHTRKPMQAERACRAKGITAVLGGPGARRVTGPAVTGHVPARPVNSTSLNG